MSVNVVAERGWILARCADELRGRLGWTVNAREAGRTEYHVPYWLGLDRPRPDVRVGFFTHGFDRAGSLAGQFDAGVAMNVAMRDVLRDAGLPVAVARPGVDHQPQTAPVFGVLGRTYGDGRKGEDLVDRLVADGHRLLALGPGPWPCASLGTDPCDTDAFWRRVDYLLVTSRDEGGPMPVLDALARRVPVVAPDVGWCAELPTLAYDAGDYESLSRVLEDLTHVPTWQGWADAHAEFFAGLERRAA